MRLQWLPALLLAGLAAAQEDCPAEFVSFEVVTGGSFVFVIPALTSW